MRYSFHLLIASLLLFSCQNERSPDLILYNGKIWTGEDLNTFDEALAITDGIITEMGNSSQVLEFAGESTRKIDLGGKLVIAGFNDAHMHFLSGSLGLLEADLLNDTTLEQALDKTLDFIAKNPQKEWVTGRGWQYTFFESGLPDHESMAALDIDRPVFLKAYDGHSAYANKAALKLAGIDSSTDFEGFGELVKDGKGEPTGVLKEEAMGLVASLIKEPTYEEKLEALRKGLEMAASLGITSVQNASGTEEDLRLFQDLLRKGELTVRYSAAFSIGSKTTEAQINRFEFLKDSLGDTNPLIRADAVKFMIDGVIESHSAAMLRPYSDLQAGHPDSLGSLSLPVERYQKLVQELDRKGFRLLTHAIGDRGVREALAAYGATGPLDPFKETRHRVEHIEMISPDDLDRFALVGVMASMQPIHADPGTIAVWQDAVGEERLPYSFAWNSLLKADAQLVFSSDWPAAISPDPLRGIHVAVNRRAPDGFPQGGWVPEQKVTLAQALSAYTYLGAYSTFEETKKGLLQVGFMADLVVLSDDLFEIDPMKIHEVSVEKTIMDGKVIFEK